MHSVELFTGAGGLGMGCSLAGFEPAAVIEWDRWACDTIRENQQSGFPLVADWPLHEGDVRGGQFDLAAGGAGSLDGRHGRRLLPPSQPPGGASRLRCLVFGMERRFLDFW